MNVETALIEVGDKPLSQCPYSSRLMTIFHLVKDKDVIITKETTGQEALTTLYQLSDAGVRERILQMEIGVVRARDGYKTVLLVMSASVAAIGVLLTVAEVTSEEGVTNNEALTSVIQNTFDIIKVLVGG